jgi:hypothetical protein
MTTSDPFDQEPLGDGRNSAWYDPSRNLIRHSTGRRRSVASESAGVPLYRTFNPEKSRVGIIIDAQSQQGVSALVSGFHEMVHWQQYCATSIGALLASIRARQYDWIGAWSEISTASQKKVAKWRAAGHRPFLLTTSLRAEQAHLPDDVVPFSNIWWEYNWTSKLFLEGLFAKDDSGGMETGQIVGNVLGDIASMILDDDKRSDERWLFELRSLYTNNGFDWLMRGQTGPKDLFDFGWDVVIGTLSRGLTTRDLFEAGAVLHELRYAMYLDAAAPAKAMPKVNTRWRERLSDPYFKAIRVFSEALRLDDPGLVAALEQMRLGFLSVLDLSLNPPVPPFLKAPNDRDNWSAAQLYPPARFSSLCAFLERRGAGFLPSSMQEVSDFESELCEETGLAVAGRLEPPWLQRTPYDLVSLENQGLEATTKISLLDYWMAVHRRYWQLRNEYIGFGIDYLGAVRLEDDPSVNEVEFAYQHGAHCLPLLQLGPFPKEIKLLPALGMDYLQLHLLTLSVRDSLLDQVFTSAGPVSLRHYPKQIRDNLNWREDFEDYLYTVFPYMPVKVVQS